MAIEPAILGVLDIFYGCKNVHLGVNGNHGAGRHEPMKVT